MARVSAHGKEIGTIQLNSKAFRFMSDGVILKNHGFGWKLHGKVKAGEDPRAVFEAKAARQALALEQRPALAAYRKALHAMAGMGLRWKLEQCINMMPGDPDGVWSECCDGYGDNVHADIDEVVELCQLHAAAVIESENLKAEAEQCA